jgi:hypothetical protein
MHDPNSVTKLLRVRVAGGCVIAPDTKLGRRCARIELDPMTALGSERGRRLDPLSQLALVAVQGARRDAGLGAVDQRDTRDTRALEGVAVGSALGATTTSVRYARRLVGAGAAATNPIDFPDSIDGAPAAHVALDLGLGGPSLTCVDGFSSGISALTYAARQIAWGRATRMHVVVGDKLDALFAEALANAPAYFMGENGLPCCPSECVMALVLERSDLRGQADPNPQAGLELVGFLDDATNCCWRETGRATPLGNGTVRGQLDHTVDGWTAPLSWVLDPNGAIRLARQADPGSCCLKDPSGALDLAGAWLAARGSVESLIGGRDLVVPGQIADRVYCGKRMELQLGFVRWRGQ